MSGTSSGPPDHPGVVILQLQGDTTTDAEAITALLTQGYQQLYAPYSLNGLTFVAFQWGYGGQGRQ